MQLILKNLLQIRDYLPLPFTSSSTTTTTTSVFILIFQPPLPIRSSICVVVAAAYPFFNCHLPYLLSSPHPCTCHFDFSAIRA